MKQNNMDSVCWPRITALSQSNPARGYGSHWVPQQNQPPTSLVPGGTGIYCTRKLPFYLLMLFICLCDYICLSKSFSPECSRRSFLSGFVITSKLDLLWYLVWDGNPSWFYSGLPPLSDPSVTSCLLLQPPCLSYINLLFMLPILIPHSALKLVLVTTFLHPQFQNPLFPFRFFPWKP